MRPCWAGATAASTGLAAGAGPAPPHEASTRDDSDEQPTDASSSSLPLFGEVVEHAQEAGANFLGAGAGATLRAVRFGHVEHVGDALPSVLILATRDREAELVQRVGEREEQAGAIAREDLDHRVAGRGAVVDRDLGADRGAGRSAQGDVAPRPGARDRAA